MDKPTDPGSAASSATLNGTQVGRPGATLAAARVAQGLSIEDISRQLKLSVAQIKSIEADDHSKLPSPVFVRGFIRSYARIVKLDAAQLLPPKNNEGTAAANLPSTGATSSVAATSTTVTAANPPEIPADVRLMQGAGRESVEPSPYRRLPALLGGIACVILVLAYYEFVMNVPPPAPPAPLSPAVSVLEPAIVSATVVPESAVVAVIPAKIEAPIEPLTLKKSNAPISDAARGLHFVFTGESWVEVRDGDGKVVFSRTNTAGTERRVQGDPPFSVVVGGASKVQLNFNGKAIDLAAYSSEDVARLRLE